MNKIFSGEKIGVVGKLRAGSATIINQDVFCRILTMSGELIREIKLTLDPDNSNFYGLIDTTGMSGSIRIRIVAKSFSGDMVVGNKDVIKTIYK